MKIILMGEPMGLFMANETGSLSEVNPFTASIAGAEYNVAVGLARLGHTPAYCTRLGFDPLGERILNGMRKNAIATDLVMQTESAQTGFMMKGFTQKGDPDIAYYRKGSAASQISTHDIDGLDLSGCEWLHVTGIFPAVSPSALAASLDGTRVPVEVYHNLISTVRANLDKMHRYVRLRKKLLGVDELHMYDVYAPMVSGIDAKIPYEEAKETVYQAVAPLGREYQAIIREGLDNRWIDVYENVGKRSGGYMSGSMVHPYILLNYQDDLDGMFTLAHELGHAVHSYLSNKTQPTVYRDYVIFVAEVASTCNEALLMEHLLKTTTDKRRRAWLINHFLEQFKGTLYRQTMFAEFELRMGELSAQGETLTADLLSREYRALNEAYFGPDMVSDDQIALEWSRIPHFYYNYYVFQYATGYSAAIALSRRILQEGEPAVKDYLEFLSGGCSKDPIDLLKGAGVDMASPEPIQAALDLFDTLLDEMEQLMED